MFINDNSMLNISINEFDGFVLSETSLVSLEAKTSLSLKSFFVSVSTDVLKECDRRLKERWLSDQQPDKWTIVFKEAWKWNLYSPDFAVVATPVPDDI